MVALGGTCLMAINGQNGPTCIFPKVFCVRKHSLIFVKVTGASCHIEYFLKTLVIENFNHYIQTKSPFMMKNIKGNVQKIIIYTM